MENIMGLKFVVRLNRPSINQGFAIALVTFFWWLTSPCFPYEVGGFFSGELSWAFDICFGIVVFLYVAGQILVPGFTVALQDLSLESIYLQLKTQYPKASFNTRQECIMLPFEMKDGFDVNLKIEKRPGEAGTVNVLFDSAVEGNLVFIQHFVYWGSVKVFCKKLMILSKQPDNEVGK